MSKRISYKLGTSAKPFKANYLILTLQVILTVGVSLGLVTTIFLSIRFFLNNYIGSLVFLYCGLITVVLFFVYLIFDHFFIWFADFTVDLSDDCISVGYCSSTIPSMKFTTHILRVHEYKIHSRTIKLIGVFDDQPSSYKKVERVSKITLHIDSTMENFDRFVGDLDALSTG